MVNKELYTKLKAGILDGNYTVEEVSETLRWIRMEYTNKRIEVIEEIRVRDVEDRKDQYSNLHKYDDGPDRE